MDQRFRKSERLKSKKTIDRLFARNNEEILALFSYPLKIVALPGPAEGLPQILISVSKRHFKRAVDRNQIKRRIREAYRLNKELLVASGEAPASIAFVYVAKEILSYADIEKKVKVVLRKLSKSEQ